MIVVTGAVEGIVDEAIVRRLVDFVGGSIDRIVVKMGKEKLLGNLPGYNQAARHAPWVVLIDLDQDAACAPEAQRAWLADCAPAMCFRIAVRAAEAWLLADREGMAHFLAVSDARIPGTPEGLDDPKREIVDIAGHSRRRVIREGIVPRPGSGRKVGSEYSSLMIEFTLRHWQPATAAAHSDSLRRCIDCLRSLMAEDVLGGVGSQTP